MLEVIEKVGILIAPIISGVVTFLITKYKYYKNVPLDKLEIAYNRVYYPIRRIIKNEKDVAKIINSCDMYFLKYDKYMAASTKIAFRYLKESNVFDDAEHARINFSKNVDKISSVLRRRLGYLDGTFFEIYQYCDPLDKRQIEIIVEFLVIYVLIAFSYIINIWWIQYILIAIALLIGLVMVVELLWVLVNFIKRKIMVFIRNHKK